MGVDLYHEKWTLHRIFCVVDDLMCTILFRGYNISIHQKLIAVISYHLIFSIIENNIWNQFDIIVTNSKRDLYQDAHTI